MKVVSIINQKGGVAKTTTTANLGASLASRGQTVVVVDLCPQANLTLGLGGGWKDLPYRLNDVLVDHVQYPLSGMIRKPGQLPLYLAAGHMNLSKCEVDLAREEQRLRNLSDAIVRMGKAYPVDWVLIDCPPSLGPLTQSAIVASTHILVPTEPKMYAFAGMDTLNRLVADLSRRHHVDAELLGVLLTFMERRTKLHRTVAEVIREHFGSKLFDTMIYRTVRISEAEAEGKPVILLDPKSAGARAYEALADEVMSRTGSLSVPAAAAAVA